MSDNTDVARYYDANTKHFLRFGGSGDTAAIHRAIWAPEVQNKAEAFAYLNNLIATFLRDKMGSDPTDYALLDLGCGVGGTATHLHRQLGIAVTGVSISQQQIEIAEHRAAALQMADKLHFVQADFAAMPDQTPFDAACAIESFVHSDNAGRFFEMLRQRMKPNGTLVICDDFRGASQDKDALRDRQKFTRGWHIKQLLSVQEIQDAAAVAGFRLIQSHDLSHFIRPFPSLLLWSLNQLTRLPLPFAYWQNLAGGTALQRCLKLGWTRYYALVFTFDGDL